MVVLFTTCLTDGLYDTMLCVYLFQTGLGIRIPEMESRCEGSVKKRRL
jgi:hypothetical protein